jgi:8-oxo-dGTP pyrophosphatase MutT (NUDIX family)
MSANPPEPESSPSSPPDATWFREADGAEDVTLEENWLFRLRRERFRSRVSGRAHDFYVLQLADAVHAIALTPDDRMVLVRQFRAASGHDSLEPPGGLLDPGEDPCEAGARELLEETGYVGDPPVLLGTFWSNPSILTSRTATIVITNVRRVAEPTLDHNEEVAVELVPAGEVPRMIQEGRIDHALCVAGLLWWLQSRPGGPLAPA